MTIQLKSLLLPIHSNLSFIARISVATGLSYKNSQRVLEDIWNVHKELRANMQSRISQLGPEKDSHAELWGIGHYFIYTHDEVEAFHGVS